MEKEYSRFSAQYVGPRVGTGKDDIPFSELVSVLESFGVKDLIYQPVQKKVAFSVSPEELEKLGELDWLEKIELIGQFGISPGKRAENPAPKSERLWEELQYGIGEEETDK